MAVKGSQLIHTGNTVLVQRLQTAGPGSVNIPTTKINELGNSESVAVTHDVPDLTFTMESYDMTPAAEAMATDIDPGSGPYPLGSPKALDIASQWLGGATAASPFDVVESVAIPQLTLESVSYRVGVNSQAGKTFTYRGDSIFYNPGPTVVEKFNGTNTAGQNIALTHVAGIYNGDVLTGPRYAQNVAVNGSRLLYGVDYTEIVTGSGAFKTVHVVLTKAAPVGTGNVRIVYFTDVTVTYDGSVHTAPSVKPAALRGKDITLLVNGVDAAARFAGVQSVQVDERLTVDRDEELGSSVATSIDYSDTPTVTGNIVLRATSPADFHARLVELLAIASSTEAIGPSQFHENRIVLVFHHPDTGAVLEALEVPDAVVTLPPFSGRVATKLDVTIPFQSDSGTLTAYDDVPA